MVRADAVDHLAFDERRTDESLMHRACYRDEERLDDAERVTLEALASTDERGAFAMGWFGCGGGDGDRCHGAVHCLRF